MVWQVSQKNSADSFLNATRDPGLHAGEDRNIIDITNLYQHIVQYVLHIFRIQSYDSIKNYDPQPRGDLDRISSSKCSFLTGIQIMEEDPTSRREA